MLHRATHHLPIGTSLIPLHLSKPLNIQVRLLDCNATERCSMVSIYRGESGQPCLVPLPIWEGYIYLKAGPGTIFLCRKVGPKPIWYNVSSRKVHSTRSNGFSASTERRLVGIEGLGIFHQHDQFNIILGLPTRDKNPLGPNGYVLEINGNSLFASTVYTRV